MNQTLDTILHRRSVRRFTREEVSPQELQAILEAGCAAPYGGFEPPVRLVVVRSRSVRERLAKAEKEGVDREWKDKPEEERYWNLFFARAPVLVAVLFKPTSVGGFDPRFEERIGLCSAACAIQNMLLAASSLGLGACIAGPMPEAKEAFEDILGAEPPWEFAALTALGRPAEPARKDQAPQKEQMIRFLD